MATTGTASVPESDTIAAIATASGPAGVGILRLSGPDAFVVADRLTPRARVRSSDQTSHTLRRVVVYQPETGEALDDALRAIFCSPRSFTGEDVVELQGHGGTLTLKQLLASALAAGARLARPGEFSERAFVNGRLDLSQAEAIADLVTAGTIEARRAAQRQLQGDLSRFVHQCRATLQEVLARIEASIDFPEEVGEVDREMLDRLLQQVADKLSDLQANAIYGRRLKEGITVVLTGRPNTGKSSLLNALSGRESAIVTAIPGTTRDIVEEALNVEGIPVRALDTAGLRETTDPVERIGVDRARAAVHDADVLVAVLDAAAGVTEEDRDFLSTLRERAVVVAVNKADIAEPSRVIETVRPLLSGGAFVVSTAAPAGTGIDDLRRAIASVATNGSTGASADAPLVTSARHEAAIREAAGAISRARTTLADALPAELIAVDAHGAMQSLGAITGETARDEIIAEIFARFCIGK